MKRKLKSGVKRGILQLIFCDICRSAGEALLAEFANGLLKAQDFK